MNKQLLVESELSDEIEAVGARVIGAAIEVHRGLGPGFLETVYHSALMLELGYAGLQVRREVPCPIVYRGSTLTTARLDVVVESLVLVELKAVETVLPIHRAQVRSYLKASGLQLGLLLNFNVELLRTGIHRIIWTRSSGR